MDLAVMYITVVTLSLKIRHFQKDISLSLIDVEWCIKLQKHTDWLNIKCYQGKQVAR